ncbi:MAG: PilZ domain-containing protein [Euryarchaeota archaeon]|nr:PilZ domain-containing protein [Euryarchaeota archaeon]
MTKTERRDCERYVFELPIQIMWKDAAGKVKEETGISRDISSSGAFMICRDFIDVDSECGIDLQIDLPVVTKSSKSRVSAHGRVVRNVSLTNPDTGYGYGIIFDNYEILRLDSGERRAESRERRAESRERRAESLEQRA